MYITRIKKYVLCVEIEETLPTVDTEEVEIIACVARIVDSESLRELARSTYRPDNEQDAIDSALADLFAPS
jgi:hypothetical protein